MLEPWPLIIKIYFVISTNTNEGKAKMSPAKIGLGEKSTDKVFVFPAFFLHPPTIVVLLSSLSVVLVVRYTHAFF